MKEIWSGNLLERPRRNRQSSVVRNMLRETTLAPHDFIAPLFLVDGKNIKQPIKSMPGINRFSLDLLLSEIKELQSVGVNAICLFGAISDSLKNSTCTEAINRDGLYPRALSSIRETFPDLFIMTDVALDPYNSDGHDGLVDKKTGQILNDATVEILCQMSLLQAQCGATCLGPSDMMDGRIGAIRRTLESEGFKNTMIMSYTAKYASACYGPFREALDSAPKSGDKKTYQMDPANVREALREARLDALEGADILMVKPALMYLDVIAKIKASVDVPVSAYNVSGEYAMIKSAAELGRLDGTKTMLECLLSIKRAGADVILTYFAKEASALLNG